MLRVCSGFRIFLIVAMLLSVGLGIDPIQSCYLSNSGSDQNTCTDRLPCLTIGRALEKGCSLMHVVSPVLDLNEPVAISDGNLIDFSMVGLNASVVRCTSMFSAINVTLTPTSRLRSITLANLTFEGCQDTYSGGVLRVTASVGSKGTSLNSVSITGCNFTRCQAGCAGGCVDIDVPVNLTLAESTFTSNTAGLNCTTTPTGGGAVRLGAAGSRATVTDCVFTQNEAPVAGALLLHGRAVVLRSTFRDNKAQTLGGGLAIFDTADVRINTTTFAENLLDGPGDKRVAGAGLHIGSTAGGLEPDSQVVLADTLFDNNVALRGSPITEGVCYIAAASLALLNCTFADNRIHGLVGATGAGLAAYVGRLSIVNGTFFRNSAAGAQTSGALAVYGGGAHVTFDSEVALAGVVFRENTISAALGTAAGGGLCLSGRSGAHATLAACLFERNTIGLSRSSQGGALYLEYSQLVVTETSFLGNGAEAEVAVQGGAVHLTESPASMDRVLFVNNLAHCQKAAAAGAISFDASLGGLLALTHCNLSSNTVHSNVGWAYGGAIHLTDGGSLSLSNTSATRNTAMSEAWDASGGFLHAAGSDHINLIMEDAKLEDNRVWAAGVGSGGAVCGMGLSVLVATRVAFRRNLIDATMGTTAQGAAVSALGGTLALAECIFEENQARSANYIDGGVVQLWGSLSIHDITFRANEVIALGGLSGGVAFLTSAQSGVALWNLQFVNNTAQGALTSGGLLLIGHAIDGPVVCLIDTVSMTDNTVRAKTASGGLLFWATTHPTSVVSFSRSSVSRNTVAVQSAGFPGIAFSNTQHGGAIVEDCEFLENRATSAEGSLWGVALTFNLHTATVARTRFVANYGDASVAVRGTLAAICPGSLTISDSAFARNQLDSSGVASGAGAAFAHTPQQCSWNLGYSEVRVEGSVFTENSVQAQLSSSGGGLAAAAMDAFTVSNCTFVGNRGDSYQNTAGAALWSALVQYQWVTNSTFRDNSAEGLGSAMGGAVHASVPQSQLIFDGVDFANNTAFSQLASAGGAFQVSGCPRGLTPAVVFSRVTFTDCRARDGGAIMVDGSVALREVAFRGCQATGQGGAVLAATATLLAANCTCVQGRAKSGGCFAGVERANLALINCTLAHTRATDHGAAIDLDWSTLRLTNSTVSRCGTLFGNGGAISAAAGSGVSLEGDLLVNCMAKEGGALYAIDSQIASVDVVYEGLVAGTGAAWSLYECQLRLAGGSVAHCAASTGAGFLTLTEARLSDVLFLANQAELSGGALHASASSLLLTRVQFKANTAVLGGALHAENSSCLTAVDCQFRRNVGRTGGAMQATDTVWSFSGTTFEENQATEGGAIVAEVVGPAALSDCRFLANAALTSTSAVHLTGTPEATLSVRGTTFARQCSPVASIVPQSAAVMLLGVAATLGGTTFDSNAGGALCLAKQAQVSLGMGCAFRDNVGLLSAGRFERPVNVWLAEGSAVDVADPAGMLPRGTADADEPLWIYASADARVTVAQSGYTALPLLRGRIAYPGAQGLLDTPVLDVRVKLEDPDALADFGAACLFVMNGVPLDPVSFTPSNLTAGLGSCPMPRPMEEADFELFLRSVARPRR
ncbi:hypothetical protein PAPYR_8657 [Paratrimastix pyriformis]|uniref:Right handed beta helix domain-containing protein n=1 Tax=Paratrimastix pyriformis TaxID=342808 RepID=A0ABQ8UFP1_9EUKA|nr:hypothetical protein PAPYR_8657 [Paratrimastix pyriformis]